MSKINFVTFACSYNTSYDVIIVANNEKAEVTSVKNFNVS